MNLRKLSSLVLAACFIGSALGLARADEGMWTFNNVPKAEIKQRYGFDVSDAWLKKVQLASVRFNSGGSGSFVSPDGLVLTNHHIASDVLQKISTAQKNYFNEGFYAHSKAEEQKAPDLELDQLISIEDVTSRVNAGVKPNMTPAEANNARSQAVGAIEQESTDKTGLRSDVITLYQGGQYNLYRYKKYTDVRLVFAPEFTAAFFGGDPDNFTYPRYDLDMALFRVYENDKPIHVDNYFKWSKTGTKNGDLIFVPGNPGSTARLDTVAHLDYMRDTSLPFVVKYLTRTAKMLHAYSALGDEQERRAHEDLFSTENSLKALRGQEEGLQDPNIMAKKVNAEKLLRQQVAANPALQKNYSDAWDAIAKERQALPGYNRQYSFLNGLGFNSDLFGIAREIVRMTAEDAKPDAERLPEYASARRQSLELALFSPAPIYPDFEKYKLADSLAFMQEELGADSPIVKAALNGKTPQARAAELIDGTKLNDVNYRKLLAKGGVAAVSQSTDPMIVLARTIDPEALALRKRYETEVVSVERPNYARIAQAIFALKGDTVYPDATFTLRLSYGTVKGYEEHGRAIEPYTDFAGAYQHMAKHGGKTPYQLPPTWLAKKSALDLKTPLNFVSTADIIGGNSGSPVIDRNAELVGLIFDGNIESLVGDFIYDSSQNRSVSVDSRGMIEALRKIYGANDLADELTR